MILHTNHGLKIFEVVQEEILSLSTIVQASDSVDQLIIFIFIFILPKNMICLIF